jgi:hypothetical protein
MTSKEKAKELFNEYYSYLKANLMNDEEAWEDAKVCALIAVDEILELLNHDLGHDQTARALEEQFQEVKQEIEKL